MAEQYIGSPSAVCSTNHFNSSDTFSQRTIHSQRVTTRSSRRRVGIVALAAGFLLAAAFADIPAAAQTLAPGWTQLSPATSPGTRYLDGITYDAGHGQVVLFGGSSQGTELSDTWLWNGATWTQANPATSPAGRSAFGMTYDATQGQVVLFGGRSSPSTWTGDTWQWNGTTWTQANPVTSPGARSNMTMVYDPAQGNDLMFGGLVEGTAANDTWVWNGANWTQQNPASSPTARSSYSMVYDAAHQQVVLFGGSDTFGNKLNDTWIWNGSTWIQESPANVPPARFGQGMAYDAALGEVVMFGGISGSGDLEDTWVWDGSNWTQQTVSTGPSAREALMAYDDVQNQLLLFGGLDSSNATLSDTWTFGLPQNFGNANVCSLGTPAPCSNTVALTYNFSTTINMGTPQVVTQGATGLDFSQANGGNCSGTVNSGSSCTIDITFAPTAVGQRMGAVNLYDNSGNLLVSTPIFGNGEAAVAAFSPLTTFVESTGTFNLSSPKGIAIDAAGDIFVSDTGNSRVVEIEAAGAGFKTVGTGWVTPQGIAVDGAGNLYVADPGLNSPTGEVIEVPVGCTTAGCQIVVYNPAPHPSPLGVAVDGLGNLYVADNPAGVVKIPPGCTVSVSSSCQTTIGTGLSQPTGVAVDSLGNIFVSDSGLFTVVKIPAGCTTSSCQSNVGLGWAQPQSVKLDAAGDVIVADPGQNAVIEVPVGCAIQACQITVAFPGFPSLAGTFQPYDATTDGQGNFYIADVANNRIDSILPGFQAFNFAESSVGNVSGDSPRSVLFQNIGNQSLTSTSPGLVFTDPNFSQSPVSGPVGTPAACTTTFTLMPGRACTLNVAFDPLSTGPATGFADFYDNALNNSASLQSFPFTGTGVAFGSEFTLGVTGVGSGSGTVTDNLTAINCSSSNGVTTGLCAGSYEVDTTVTLTATSSQGSTFTGWGGECANFNTQPTCNVFMSSNTNVTATFTSSTSNQLTVTDLGTGSGTVIDNVDLITCIDTNGSVTGQCSASYTNPTVTLTATPSGNSIFAGWGGACASSGANPMCQVTMTPMVNVTASFVAPGAAQPGLLKPITAGVVYGQGGSFTSNTDNKGGVGPNSLADPAGSVLDSNGNLYVGDTGNDRVLFYPAGSTVPTRVYGQSGSFTTMGNNQGGISANSLNNPYTVALDSSGNLYVADLLNSRVLYYPAGTTTATRVYGQGGSFTSSTANNGGVNANSLNLPYGVALDSSGNLYVADTGNNRVLFYPAGSTTATRVYGQNGSFSTNTANNGGISANGLDGPLGLALDSSGDLYVADEMNNRVLFYPSGSTTATRVYGQGGSFTSSAANNGGISANSLNQPFGVSLDSSGDLYIGDTFNDRVLFYPFGSTTATRVYGQLGSFSTNTANPGGVSANTLVFPEAVPLDSSGNLYVADYGNNRVVEYGTFGNVNVCPGGTSTPAPCNSTITLSYYAAAQTNFGVSQVVTQGAAGLDFSLANGNTCTGTVQAGSPCLVNATFAPLAPGLRTGAVTLFDDHNNVLATQPIYGVGQGPAAVFNPATPIVAPIGNASVLSHNAVAVDAAGDLFLSSGSNAQVVEVAANSNISSVGTGLSSPAGLAVDGGGDVYIADSGLHEVVKAPTNGTAQTVAYPSTPNSNSSPSGVAVDGTGDLFVADAGLHEVVEIPANGGPQSIVYPLTPVSNSTPSGVAVDGAGNLFIADSGLGTVVEIPAGCVNVNCQITVGGGWSQPLSVSLDAAGDAYVADAGLSAVVEAPAGCNSPACEITVAGNIAALSAAVDDAGDVYFVYSGSNSVFKDVRQANFLALGFGSVTDGSETAPKTFALQNIGNQTLSAVSPGLQITDADFVQANASSPGNCTANFSLTAGASCNVSIAFFPLTPGPDNGFVDFTDNSLNAAPATQAVNVVGTGVPPVINSMLTVTPVGSGAGTVTDNSSAISCSDSNGSVTGTCSASYQNGTNVTLTATASGGSTFTGWGGACASSGTAPTCSLSINAATSVSASFVQQNFGGINVCPTGQITPAPCSQTLPVTFNIPANTTIGATQVVTQGVTGLDFSLASGSTCTGTFSTAGSCNVNVNFTPLAPGSRSGAVELYDNNGNQIASAFIYGTGMAPAIAFGPATPAVVNTGSPSLSTPNGAVVDAAGDLYIAVAGNGEIGGGAEVLKVAPNGAVSTVGSGLAYPQGLAVDGAGDLFIADNNQNKVFEVTPAGVQTGMDFGLTAQLGVAVDGAGDVFVSDFNANEVVEAPPGCTSGACTKVVFTAPAGLHPIGLAVDAAGDLFTAVFADSPTITPGEVVEIPAGCTTSSCQTTVGTGWSEPEAVAVDAAGDVFVADELPRVVEVPAGCSSSSCQITLSRVLAFGIAVDAKGDVIIADRDNNVTTDPDSNQVVVLQGSLPPSLNFALTNANSTSADSPQTVTVQNVGNNTLTGSVALSLGANFTPNAGTCTPISLAPGASCFESFSFTPQTTGFFTASADFSDNTLNLSSAVVLQQVNMSGIGGLNGHAVTAAVPNVVGLIQPAASSSLTGAGLTTGSVSMASSSVVPSGSVIASNPPAGTQVSLGSAVKLQISNGPGQPPTPNPLSLMNNFFVTGDFAAGGVNLRGAPVVGKMVTGIINIPASSGPGSPGVPTGADLIDGFFYWTTLESSATPSGANGTFLGFPITGQQIGSDLPYTDTAASVSGTLRVYRADVNTWFQNGAGGIRIGSGNFQFSLPSTGSTGVLLAEGGSLIVIYRVLSPAFPLKAVVIYDGSAIPPSSTTQNMQGFYDAVGGAGGTGEVTTLFLDPSGWNTANSTPTLGKPGQYNAPIIAGDAYGAIVLSTPVNNPDNDGILGAWKAGPPASDFHGGQPGYYDVKTGIWIGLPGAKAGEKDLFVQLDYMCGGVLEDGSCDPQQENLFPSPDSLGNDPLAMVQQAFLNSGIVLHLQIGNIVPESTCVDTPGQPCQFPGEPGVVGWKNSLEFSKVWPRNFASCVSGGDCSPRFPYGQKDSYHYVLFGHSLAIPAWNTRYGSLLTINAVKGGITTITTTDRGKGINACPSRITISGVQGMPSLNGIYNTSSCPDTSTIIIPTPTGVSSWSFPNTTLAEPVIGITSGTVTSISGYSDLGGADSAITLGLWETDPNQNMSKKATVIAGTLFHEIGHTLGLSHGGLYYDTPGSYVPTFEANCKPNFQSIMNYSNQLIGVGPNSAIAYSNQTLTTLTQPTFGSVTSLLDTDPGFVGAPATFPTSSWYVPSEPAGSTESAATLHCDGTPLAGDSGFLVTGPIAPVTPPWTNGQNITFDGVPYSTLRGYNDVANVDLRQVGATGGQMAELSSLLAFSSSTTPLNIAPGGSVSVGPGGSVALGPGGSISVGGGNVTVPSGGTITGGGTITFGTGGSATLSSAGTAMITPGTNGIIGLPNGGTILSGGGTITLGGGGTITLGGGGNITLGGGGTITLPGGAGTITIPSGGGSYLVPAGGSVTLGGSGGTITLGGGGTITLGGGGNITLGGGGTITLGGGGNITLGGGGNITLGGGGTITLGGGGNVTLGGGGNVTLGGGGTVTLGGGGEVSVGSGGNVTLGAGGTVTLGGGGNITLGGGGTITLGGGGNVTLGAGGGSIDGTMQPAGGPYPVPAGGTITVGAGGNITLGGGGTITLGGGGNITLGGGGVVTLGGGGTITLGGGGNITLGGGGNVTLGGGGATSTELNYDTANSVVYPPPAATYTMGLSNIRVNWTAPAFGVVQTYTISRSVNGGNPVVIGSVSGVNGFAPATTFTDTNPVTGTLLYTIATTLVPDRGTTTSRQSSPSPPAMLTIDQSIALGSLPSSVSITSSTLAVTATAKSMGSANNQLVSFNTTGPCSAGSSTINASGVSSATVALNSTGSCTVTASQAGSTGFNAADPVSGTFMIVSANSNIVSQTITFPQLPNAQYGSSPLAVSATTTSNLHVTFSASGQCNNTTTYNMIKITGAGTCFVTASAPSGPVPNSNTTYSAASVTQSFTIFPAPLTVTAGNLTIAYGQPIPSLTNDFQITGFVNGETAAVLNNTAPALSTTATSASAPGPYPITVSTGNLAAANYSFRYVNGTLTITFTGSVPHSGTTCNGAYSGTFNGNLTVSKGQNCVFIGGGASGNITETGGNLVLNGSTVTGQVTVNGGGTFTIGPSTTIKGNLTIQGLPKSTTSSQVCGSTIVGNVVIQSDGAPILIGSGTASCARNIIKGNLQVVSNSAAVTTNGNSVTDSLQVQSNSGATTIDGNTIGASLQDLSNTGATQVFNNIITSALQCQSNSSITGGGNKAASKSGQCAKF